MHRVMRFSIIFSTLAFATNVGAQDTLKPNQTYRDVIRLSLDSGSTQIPLPPGDWVLAGYDEPVNNKGYRFIRGHIIRTTLNVLTGIVSFHLPTEYETHGWEAPALCDRKDLFFLEGSSDYDVGDGAVSDCWGIGRVNIHLPRSSNEAMRMLADFISDNSIIVPRTMVSVKYARTNSSNFLIISYYFHKGIEGTDPTTHFSPSNMDVYKAWGRKWKLKVDAGFLGKLAVFNTKAK